MNTGRELWRLKADLTKDCKGSEDGGTKLSVYEEDGHWRHAPASWLNLFFFLALVQMCTA